MSFLIGINAKTFWNLQSIVEISKQIFFNLIEKFQ